MVSIPGTTKPTNLSTTTRYFHTLPQSSIMNHSNPFFLLLGFLLPSSSSLTLDSSSSSLSSPFFFFTGFCGTGGNAFAGGPIFACSGAIRCLLDMPVAFAPPNLANTLDKSSRAFESACVYIAFLDLQVCQRMPSGLSGLPLAMVGPGDCLTSGEPTATR